MRAWWCGFALGVIGLQRQAVLPDWSGWCALMLLGCIAILVAAWVLCRGASGGWRGGSAGEVCNGFSSERRGGSLGEACGNSPGEMCGNSPGEMCCDSSSEMYGGSLGEACGNLPGEVCNDSSSEVCSGPLGGSRWSASVVADTRAVVANSRVGHVLFSARARSCVGWGALWIAALCVGFGYAAWRAETRLAVSLPSAWEGRDIDVVGSIKGLPSRDDKGARFLFDVDSADAPIAAFPRVIQLSWIAEDAPPPLLEPGARWHLTVRLKRPHGNANFGVRDAEASLLARNVRATGYVSAPAHAVRLPGDAHGVSVTVDRWRAALRARIDTVLADAPHRGIVVALAIGAQDEVSADDWLLMRGTGTSHLVAIKGSIKPN